MKKRYVLASLYLVLVSASAHALKLQPIASLGLDWGGAKMASFSYAGHKDKSFRAGSLVLFTGGVAFANPFRSFDLSTRLSLGFKTASLSASNANLDFFRGVAEIEESYAITATPFRAGLGLSYHFFNRIRGTGIASTFSSAVEPSFGYFVDGEYVIVHGKNYPTHLSSVVVGIRFTQQSYRVKNNPTDPIAASSAGLHLKLLW
ncbi:MAG: hypothetical protein ABIR96_08815 [Bdellovibrionota bacterium]